MLFQLDSLRSAITKIRSGESEREYEMSEQRKRAEIENLETDKAQMEAQVTTSYRNHVVIQLPFA